MHLNFYIQPKLKTELRTAPHIIQSIEVLALPMLDLNNFVQEQLEQNPVLEEKDFSPDENQNSNLETSQETEKSETQIDEDFLNNFENLESEDFKEYFAENNIPKKFGDEKDKKHEALQNTAAPQTSLQDHLCEQLYFFELPKNILELAKEIIYNLDGKGYVMYSLEEIIAPWKGVSLEDAELALSYVQKLEPTGVGARNIKECLLLQLNTEDSDYAFQKLLIENHLEDIYENKYPKIVKETGRTIDEIKEAINSLQKLNPKPGGNISGESAHIIIPDVIVRKEGDEYVVYLEEEYIPQLRVSNTYRYLLKEKNSDAKDFIKKKMESANWIIDAIKQRQQTLRSVCEEIVKHQKDFLEHGITHLKPLKMKDLADILEICISTVSRAISRKYIETPRGIFPLKFFFTGSITKNDGGEDESRVSVQERIQKIVDQEDKKNPLSDVEISEKLKDAGLDIARRTVSKYREFLKIPSSRRRKEY